MKTLAERRDQRRALAVIRDAKPFADADVRRALADVPASVLLDIAGSRENWVVRRAALRALDGRLAPAQTDPVLAIVTDDACVEELRCEALTSLADTGATHHLPALRTLRAAIAMKQPPPYRLGDSLEAAAARLGDTDAFLPALRLRYDAWTHRRTLGEQAAVALEARHGRDALARLVGARDASRDELTRLALAHPEPAVRRWALDLRGADPASLESLADPDPIVAEAAEAQLVGADDAFDDALRARVVDRRIEVRSRARALTLMLRRGARDEATTLYAAYPELRIALPTVPPDVRAAILAHYLPGERGTDPRWRLEGAIELGLENAVERELPDAAFLASIAAAEAALRPVAQSVGAAIPIGTVRNQGGGSYVEILVDMTTLEISALGPYVTSQGSIPARFRHALEVAGFHVVDEALARTRFDGLNVYFFGAREPLGVYDLLFYWQD